MYKGKNKRLTLWKSNKETKELIDTLSLKVRIPTFNLIEVYKGKNKKLNKNIITRISVSATISLRLLM